MSTNGELSDPIFLPNGQEVFIGGHNNLCWSPDGERLAFASFASGNLDIYTINANGTGFARVTEDPAMDESPSWSPDGLRIAFLSNRNNAPDIYIHDLSTGNETRLTTTSDHYFSPVWSPDRVEIAYCRNVSFSAGDEIYILDVTTGVTTPVGELPGQMECQGLQWAPSPDRLLFYTPSLFGDVYAIGTNGFGLESLTDIGNDWTMEPSWYTGNQVLYVKTLSDGGSEPRGIYTMSASGSGHTLLKAFDSYARSPVYRFAAVDRPDLVVSSHSSHVETNPPPPNYVVSFTIRNVGTAPSRPAWVYVDAIDPNPFLDVGLPPQGVNEIRSQRTARVAALQQGEESGNLQVTFDLADLYRKEVQLVRITVDPKGEVNEAFETNNSVERVWP